MSETALVARIRLYVAKAATLFRNNCGVANYPDGSVVRYGVASPGGSDLLGWRSVIVTPDMLGKRVAIFTAVEVKTEGGRVSPEQLNFIKQVQQAGGHAGVAQSEKDALDICNGRCDYNNR